MVRDVELFLSVVPDGERTTDTFDWTRGRTSDADCLAAPVIAASDATIPPPPPDMDIGPPSLTRSYLVARSAQPLLYMRLFLSLAVVASSLGYISARGEPQQPATHAASSRSKCHGPTGSSQSRKRTLLLQQSQRHDSAGLAVPLAFVDPPAATSTILEMISTLARQHPYGAAFSVAATKGGLADVVAQRSEQAQAEKAGQSPHNYRRTLVFILYGGGYQGMALELLYNKLFNEWFGENIMAKLAFNQLVLTPFFTLPVAYIAKGIVFGTFLHEPGTVLKEYWYDVRYNGLLTKFWKLWTPTNFVMFAIIPPAWRITFSACISFIWTIILSRIASSAKE